MPRIAKQSGVFERRKGSGIWYAKYIYQGQKTVKSFGNDRAAAAQFLKDAKARIRLSPEDFQLQQKRQGKGTTVDELCDLLLTHIISNPARYKDQRNPPIRIAQIRDAFGKRNAESITAPEIDQWLSNRKRWSRGVRNGSSYQTDHAVAPATANRLRSTFSRMYRHGKYLGLVSSNPVRDVEPVALKSPKPNWLRPEQEQMLYSILQSKVDACTPQQPKLRQQALHRIYELDIALNTGMRKGEMYGLLWKNVDLPRKVIHLLDTKNGEARDVFLNTTAHKALIALWEMRDDLHTVQPGHVFRCGENKKWWLALLKEAGLEGQLRWHDLRHTFATRLVQKGANLKQVQVACGHKTIQMTARYAHVDDSDQRATVALLEN